jgi:hypothetical protein
MTPGAAVASPPGKRLSSARSEKPGQLRSAVASGVEGWPR